MKEHIKEAYQNVVSKKRIPDAIWAMLIIVTLLATAFRGSLAAQPLQVVLAIVGSFSVIIFVLTVAAAIVVKAFALKKKERHYVRGVLR